MIRQTMANQTQRVYIPMLLKDNVKDR